MSERNERMAEARADAVRKHTARLKHAETNGQPDSLLPRLVELSRGVARVMAHPDTKDFIQDFADEGTDAIFERLIRLGENVTAGWRGNMTRRRNRNRKQGGT